MHHLLFGKLFNVVARTGVVGEVDDSGESVETVAYSDVDGFTEDSISAPRIRYNLCVASAHVQNSRVVTARNYSAHFNVWILHKEYNTQ